MGGRSRESRLRQHFARRENPYAGADVERAARLSAALWLLGAVLVVALLPVAPPTAAVHGAGGWVIAGLVIAGAFAAAARGLRRPERVSADENLATCFCALLGIALVEWLAGGRTSPYHQLFLLSVLYTASAHPPRRFLAHFGAFVAAVLAPLVYVHTTATELGDAALQILLTLGFAVLASVQMDGVRSQRVALVERGEADRLAAETDSLTALGNRRALIAELEAATGSATDADPVVLALFDLDGFKAYNDSFGHPAGDALLERLGARLAAAVAPHGRAFRMGGDEFCVLARTSTVGAFEVIEAADAALRDSGDGFRIGASMGSALIPADASEPEQALHVADARMYARKNVGRTSAGRQSADVLMSVLSERDPTLGGHLDDVTELCERTGAELGLSDAQHGTLRAAAALHDVGKVAIPDAILQKPGPLTATEWEFVRRHTVIGERILRAAPALAAIGPLVRSSHERWDGSGYPDGLAGDAIPLPSRIVAACDAFEAMVSDRPYRAAMTTEEALAELRACAGTQFDPAIVSALERAVRAVAEHA